MNCELGTGIGFGFGIGIAMAQVGSYGGVCA